MDDVEKELNEFQEKEVGRKTEEIRLLKEKNLHVESYDQKVFRMIVIRFTYQKTYFFSL
jgi:hypothetical protein